MKEKDFQREFGKWIVEQPIEKSTVFELKIVKGPSIRYDAVREHQAKALYEAKHKVLYHKIQDSPVSWTGDTPMRFTAPKPFDCFVMKGAEAYLIIWQYIKGQRHGDREMIWIDIDVWMGLVEIGTKMSIRIEELKKHGQIRRF